MRAATLAGLALAMLLAAAPGCATSPADQAGAPFWRKAWTVAGVLGPAETARAAQDSIGKPVELTAARAATPYSFPCPNPPDYRDVKPRPRTTLSAHFGPHWRFPASLGARPVAGWVRCPGAGNIGAFAFTDSRHGWYFFEDGLILTLR